MTASLLPVLGIISFMHKKISPSLNVTSFKKRGTKNIVVDMKEQNVKIESKWRKNEYNINVIKLSQTILLSYRYVPALFKNDGKK